MIKKTITYTDYDGNVRTEEFHFNLNKAELMEMDMSASGGLQNVIQRMIDEQDGRKLIDLFKEIILKSYGQKSLDGKRFVKIDGYGHPLSRDFAQTEAYSELFMELATDDVAAAAFMNGIIPQGLAEEMAASKEIPSIRPSLPHEQDGTLH